MLRLDMSSQPRAAASPPSVVLVEPPPKAKQAKVRALIRIAAACARCIWSHHRIVAAARRRQAGRLGRARGAAAEDARRQGAGADTRCRSACANSQTKQRKKRLSDGSAASVHKEDSKPASKKAKTAEKVRCAPTARRLRCQKLSHACAAP